MQWRPISACGGRVLGIVRSSRLGSCLKWRRADHCVCPARFSPESAAMSSENAAAATSCKNCDRIIARLARWAFVTFVLCSLASVVRCMDNLGLLRGTLMTHRQISCLDKSISLRCPNGTNVELRDARYLTLAPSVYANIKEFNICDAIAAGAINNSLVTGAVGEPSSTTVLPNAGMCQWHDLLQHSLLQTAVEVCHSKQQCQFQVSPSKSGFETCLKKNETFVRVEYNCRPSSFSSKVGCEHEKVNFECEPYTRLAIYSASYGRTQYQSVQCPQPQGVAEETCLLSYATEIVINHCHGKRNCTLVADSKTFTNPCKEKSRVYLKVVYACVPRKVLLAKYEESAFWDEYPFFEEAGDPHDVLDNPKSLAPFPDPTNHVDNHNQSNGKDATLLHHLTSNTIHNSTFGDSGEKLYVYLIGGASGVFISLTVFVIARLIWKRRRSRNDGKLRDMNLADKSLPHSFNDEICEVDADVTLAQVLPAVTIIPSHHHISSPSEVVRYGKDDIMPRSLYQDDNSQFYYG